MSGKRAPSAPPALGGFSYVELLGSGGFADVFLYDQAYPKRRTAVKVMLTDRLGSSLDEFTAEANLMAQLSNHPSIVTIFQAGVSDDARPYLVMEYCSRPNLQARYRKERFAVAEALRIGVQIAGAVETAHRAGILHRDIKPANILTTQYNKPALTDFGISGTTTDASVAVGMSIPWSPPESFSHPSWSGPQSDVFALAATIYTLLAGRSPFEIPGGSNSGMDLIGRIQTGVLPALGRPDAPVSLEAVLARAMAKAPTDRYASALEFGRALQRVEIELGASPTAIDVIDETVEDDFDGDEDGGLTRIRNIVSIDPELPRVTSQSLPVATTFASTVEDRTQLRPELPSFSAQSFASGDVEHTLLRPTPPPTFSDPATETTGTAPTSTTAATALRPKRRLLAPILIGAGALVLAGVIVAVIATVPSAGPKTAPGQSAAPVDAVGDSVVPPVEKVVGTPAADGVDFTWTNPDPQDGDRYLWRYVTGTDSKQVTTTSVVVPPQATGQTCIQVTLIRKDGRGADTAGYGCSK